MGLGEQSYSLDDAAEVLPRGFGEYLLLRRIAQGGMGELYLATTRGGEERVRKTCVVKALRQDLTRDESYLTRFVDEARLVVQLHHPNLCHIFDVGRVGETYYLAMEHVRGWNLGPVVATCIEQNMQVPDAVWVHVVSEALLALDYAHRSSDSRTGQPLELVHRDVSPQNIMLSEDGSVKLIDFGIAKSTLKVERTAPRVVLGKVGYMSPEHARGLPLDGRADQYAAGIVLYELLARERFYAGLTPNEVWDQVGRGGYRPRRFGALDEDLQAVLSRALAVAREERYESCGAFEEALRQWMAGRRQVISAPRVRRLLEGLYQDEERDDWVVPGSLPGAELHDPFAAQPTVHFATSVLDAPSLPDRARDADTRTATVLAPEPATTSERTALPTSVTASEPEAADPPEASASEPRLSPTERLTPERMQALLADPSGEGAALPAAPEEVAARRGPGLLVWGGMAAGVVLAGLLTVAYFLLWAD